MLFSVVRLGQLRERNFLALAMLFLYLLATLRAVEIGNDTRHYSEIFAEVRSNLTQLTLEAGYLCINSLIGSFTDNFYVFLAVTDAVIYYAYYKLIKKYSSNYVLSVLLFLCFGFWGDTINIIRQELAIAMFLYVYILTDDGKKIRGFILGILAPLFQRTSLSYFIYFLIPRRINKKFYAIAGPIGVLTVLLIDRIIMLVTRFVPRFGRYLLDTSKYKLGRVEPAVVLYCVFLLVVWALALYVYEHAGDNIESDEWTVQIEMQINMVFTAFLIMLVATKFNLLDRCAMFFNIFVIILIPNMISMIKKDEYRHLVQSGFTLAAIGYFVVVCIFRPDWNHIYPYRMFFQSLN